MKCLIFTVLCALVGVLTQQQVDAAPPAQSEATENRWYFPKLCRYSVTIRVSLDLHIIVEIIIKEVEESIIVPKTVRRLNENPCTRGPYYLCRTSESAPEEDELAGLTPRRRLLTSLRRVRQRSVTDETPQQRAITRSSSFRSSTSQRSSVNSTQNSNDDSSASMTGTTTPKRKNSLKVPIPNHEARNLLTTYCILLLLLISLYLLYSGLF